MGTHRSHGRYGECNTHNTDKPRLLRDMFAAPCEVARVETEGTVLEVTAAHAHSVDALRAQLGHGGLAAELELSLFAVGRALRAGGRAFVPRATGDTW